MHLAMFPTHLLMKMRTMLLTSTLLEKSHGIRLGLLRLVWEVEIDLVRKVLSPQPLQAYIMEMR